MILFLVSNHISTDGCLKPFLEEYPEQCSIIVFLDKESDVIINKTGGIPITPSNSKEVVASIDFSLVTHVVVQLLELPKIKFILKYIPRSIPVVWWTFGGDLYNSFLVHRGYRLWYKQPSDFQDQSLLFKVKSYFYKQYRLFIEKRICNRLDAIIPCVEVDYQLARSYLKNDLKLLNIHNLTYHKEYVLSHGKDVLVGNSASLSNNHLYVLKYIENLKFSQSHLHVSFAYNHQFSNYSSAVRSAYIMAFGNDVSFEDSFVSRDKYVDSFLNYKAAIFGHWRQEALGNIHICIHMGIKVFLSKNSPLLAFYRNKGIKVFCLEEINQKEIDEPLSLADKENNRLIWQNFVEAYRADIKGIMHNYFDV